VGKLADERLKTSTFLVGDKLSIADLCLYFSWNEVRALLEKESKNLNNLARWGAHIAAIPI
jgi:glutathione S-transferase